MDRGVAIAALAVLLASGLAGCAGSGDGGEVVVHSDAGLDGTTLLVSNGTLPAATPPKDGSRGHIAGVVVDEAIRPIAGAEVKLPTVDLTRTTDRDGSFGFVDLVPGSYFLTVSRAGYHPAETAIEVRAGEFTRAKVILTAIPPPEPYNVTQSFQGFANVTGSMLASGSALCQACQADFMVSQDGLQSIVVEAVFDTPDPGDGRSFLFELSRNGGDIVLCMVCSSGPAPLREEVRGDDLANTTTVHVQADPQTFPVPEVNVPFHIYLTAFYNRLPPTGWSFVAGDA